MCYSFDKLLKAWIGSRSGSGQSAASHHLHRLIEPVARLVPSDAVMVGVLLEDVWHVGP